MTGASRIGLGLSRAVVCFVHAKSTTQLERALERSRMPLISRLKEPRDGE
jgi:hypothetical protein